LFARPPARSIYLANPERTAEDMQYRQHTAIRQFFATVPVPCPYLPDLSERKLVVELTGSDAQTLYAELSHAGFRRSHRLAYRPACKACRACVPIRIRTEGFQPTRSLRRVANRNADLVATPRPARATKEQYALFERYQKGRHGRSEMASMTFADYRALVEETAVETEVIEFRDAAGTLVGACLTDRMPDSLSAVYSFFEPDDTRRSLGTMMILWLVAHAGHTGLPFVYLGYWVSGSDTMDYKRRFPASEGLVDRHWVPLTAVDEPTATADCASHES